MLESFLGSCTLDATLTRLKIIYKCEFCYPKFCSTVKSTYILFFCMILAKDQSYQITASVSSSSDGVPKSCK